MKKDEIALIFPPTHDLAMPHLAIPLLSAYIESHSSIRCHITDINQLLFSAAVEPALIADYKQQIGKAINSQSLATAYLSVLSFQDKCLARLEAFHSNDSGYEASLRKFHVRFDSTTSEGIYQGINAPESKLSQTLTSILRSDKYSHTRLFGISISVEDQMFCSFLIAKCLRELYPDAKIVLGGNMVTRLSAQIANSKLACYADALITNEGEAPLLDIASSSGTDVVSHPKLINLTSPASSLVSEDFISHDVEDISPPNFSDYDLDAYLAPERFMPLLASRRCYWGKCDFCAIPNAWDPSFRQRKPEDVVNELSLLASCGTKYFRIIDEDFPPGLMRGCIKEILDKNLDVRFEAYSRFEADFLDPHFCQSLFSAGCRQLFFGLENIGAKTSELVNKGSFYTPENIKRCLANTAAAGIHNYLFVMVGIPNAPLDEEKATVSFIIENPNVHCIGLGSFVVDRMSPIETSAAIRGKYDIELFEVGDMTTEIGYTFKGVDIRKASRERAFAYIKEILQARPDLAVTTLLDEETRCIMADAFGNLFGVKLAKELSSLQVQEIVSQSIRRCSEEKIDRSLNQDLSDLTN